MDGIFIQPIRLLKSGTAGYMMFRFLLIYFYYFCQTNNLKIYLTDLRQIFRVGITMAVNDQS